VPLAIATLSRRPATHELLAVRGTSISAASRSASRPGVGHRSASRLRGTGRAQADTSHARPASAALIQERGSAKVAPPLAAIDLSAMSQSALGIASPLRFALVGAGSMGANHARVVKSDPQCRLVEVIDVDMAAARKLAATYGSQYGDSLGRIDGIDAAIVASSTDSHFEPVRTFLEAGIPTLVEKPVATSLDQVQRVVDIAASTGTPLMCGFVERFNPVVATSKQLINDDIFHIRTQRQSPPPGRYSSNAVWDLLIHDLDLVLGYFGPGAWSSLSAVGFVDKSTSSLESAEATFELHGAIASTMCSRLWQRKVRSIQIATSSTVLELDLVRQTLTIYRNIAQEQFIGGAMIYRSATTVDVPFVRHAGEPLALQLQHFVELIRGTVDAEEERTSILPPHALAETIVTLCA